MDFANIRKILDKIESHRNLCIGKWRDNAKYLALNRTFDNALTNGVPSDSNRVDKDSTDYPLVDFTAGTAMRRSSNVISTMLLGELDEDLIEVLPPEGVDADYSLITKMVNFAIRRYGNNFDVARRQYFQDSRSFGNAGIGFYYDPQDGYTFVAYGVDTLGLYIENGKISGYADIRYMTGAEINDFFNEKIYTEDNDLEKLHKCSQLFVRNDEYNPTEKLTSAQYRWTRYFIVDGQDRILKQDYFRNSPIKINREDLEIGEWYGRGRAEPLINSIVALNRAVLLSVIGGEKMIDPAVWMYVSGQMSKMRLDRRPGAANPINIADAPGGNPMGTIGDIRDPSALLQFTIPYLQKLITDAYNVDELFDLNATGKQMTAREAIIRRDIRSIVITSEFAGHKSVFQELFSDLLDDMKRRGFFDSVLEGVELPKGIDWKRIVFNGDFDLMQRTKRSSRALEYINNIAPVVNLFPEIRNANNAWKIADDIEKGAGVEDYLSTEEEYDNMLQGMMQAAANAQNLENKKVESEIERNGANNVGIGTNLPENA